MSKHSKLTASHRRRTAFVYVRQSSQAQLERKLPEYPMRTPRVIFRNLGNGKFEELDEAGPGVSAAHCSRGCAFGDCDNDGDIDILIVNLNEPPSLLRNDLGPGAGHWLKAKLIGVKSNRSAIGARVTATYGGRRQAQEVLSQSSFYSANDPRLQFGLGRETRASLDIRWPSGLTQRFLDVAADRIVTIREGDDRLL